MLAFLGTPSSQARPASTSLYGFRYYDPGTGRWLSRDPAGEAASLTLFAFLNNNQVTHVDFLGMVSIKTMDAFKHPCGGRTVDFKFSRSNTRGSGIFEEFKPGWYVQEVRKIKVVKDCETGEHARDSSFDSQLHGGNPMDKKFWETRPWYSAGGYINRKGTHAGVTTAEGRKIPDNVPDDTSFRPSRPNTCGFDMTIAILRFFAIDDLPYSLGGQRVKPNPEPGSGLHRIHDQEHALPSRHMPSSWNKPPFWDTSRKDKEPDGVRIVVSSWNCCKGEKDFNHLWVYPSAGGAVMGDIVPEETTRDQIGR